MHWLLNPRVIVALVIAGALALTHIAAYRAGAKHVQIEWNEAKALANQEARRIEQARQSRVDEAAKSHSARSAVIADNYSRAADAVRGLRNAITARRTAEESAAAATKRADTLGILLAESAEAHRELAQRCDRHVNDIRLLLEAWPK